jgi:hypothetical protein
MCTIEQQRKSVKSSSPSSPELPPTLLTAVIDNTSLERLSQSRRIRDMLDNVEQRAVLQRIAAAPPEARESLIEQAIREDKNFNTLATELLDVVVGGRARQ